MLMEPPERLSPILILTNMSKDISYTDALNELNEITREIENESIAVDELTAKLKRATELITLCRAKLRLTEEEVKKIIGEMGEKE